MSSNANSMADYWRLFVDVHRPRTFEWRWTKRCLGNQSVHFVGVAAKACDETPFVFGPHAKWRLAFVRTRTTIRHWLALRRVHDAALAAYENARYAGYITPDFAAHFAVPC